MLMDPLVQLNPSLRTFFVKKLPCRMVHPALLYMRVPFPSESRTVK